MQLPFTSAEFMEVFRSYNEWVGSWIILFYLMALIAILNAIKKFRYSDSLISSILGLFWLWMGIVYHILFFSTINPGAYIFGGMFILQGLLFFYLGIIRKKISYHFRKDLGGLAGLALLIFAFFIYPLLGYRAGHIYPAAPAFGLPCPTTIFTLGMLLWTDKKLPYGIIAIPLIWSLIGFVAAISLGIREDAGLLIAGLLTTAFVILKNRDFNRGERLEKQDSAMRKAQL